VKSSTSCCGCAETIPVEEFEKTESEVIVTPEASAAIAASRWFSICVRERRRRIAFFIVGELASMPVGDCQNLTRLISVNGNQKIKSGRGEGRGRATEKSGGGQRKF